MFQAKRNLDKGLIAVDGVCEKAMLGNPTCNFSFYIFSSQALCYNIYTRWM